MKENPPLAPPQVGENNGRKTYIIGDVQGCYRELQALLGKINFNPDRDQLGFVGDLVNRGPESLQVLKFISGLKNPLVVLGNHDFYLLILGYGFVAPHLYQHTLSDILASPQKIDLLDWLRQQAILLSLPEQQAILVHAGIPPQWRIPDAIRYSQEIHAALRSDEYPHFLKNILGDEPSHWKNNLSGNNRLRYIINAFTRMRLCAKNGELTFAEPTPPFLSTDIYRPWFDWRSATTDKMDVYFGHWAALNGKCDQPHCYPLDTGCVWGHSLTAIRLEDKQIFSVKQLP